MTYLESNCSAAVGSRSDSRDVFVVRPTDGRILNTAEFLDLPAYGEPRPANVTPASRPTPRRTRYTRAIEELRAAHQAKLKAGKQAEKQDEKRTKKAARKATDELAVGRPNTPRANTGASSPADFLRQDDIADNLAVFADAFQARAAADAAQLRALAVAYDVALDRAIAEVTARAGKNQKVPFDNDDDQRVLSWQLTSILGDYAIATNDTDQSLRYRAVDARLLVTKFPDWLTALEAGQIDLRHVHSLLKHGRQLPDEHTAEYGAVVLDFALTHTPGQTVTFAEEAAATIAATDFEEAHQQARDNRNVSARHDGFGMAKIMAYVPSELATPAVDLLERGARELRQLDTQAAAAHAKAVREARRQGLPEPAPFHPDTRTSGQMRADLFMETLLCAAPGDSRVKTVVNVTVPVFSLLDAERAAEGISLDTASAMGNSGVTGSARKVGETREAREVGEASEAGAATSAAASAGAASAAGTESAPWYRADGHGPALLDGTHPMSIEQARQFASDTSFLQRILIHPITGQVIAVDQYEMTLDMRRFLQVRDRTCRFPGCVQPAQRCDADHTHPYSEKGPTDVDNLAHLCRGHHVQKHHKPWTVTNLGGGVLEWRTPLGQVATTRPRPYGPMFLPVGEYGPPPF